MGCSASKSAALDVVAPVEVVLASPPRPAGGRQPAKRGSISEEDAPYWKVKLRAPGSEVPALAALQEKYGDAAVDQTWLELGEYKGPTGDGTSFPEGHLAARWLNLQALADQVAQAPPSLGAALEAALALRAELARYNKESRLLVQLAHTGYFVALSERFEARLDALFETYGLPQSPFWTEWRPALLAERATRVEFFREMLNDPAKMKDELGGDEQQREILTLLKYDTEKHTARLTDSELALLRDVYDYVTRESGVVLMSLPDWFVPPSEILVQEENPTTGQAFETWGGRRVATVLAADWSEELFIAQAARWSELRHVHVLALRGACHVGDRFYVHDEVMGVDKLFLEGAPKWRILYQVSLGLQYLHERQLVHSGLSMDSIVISSADNKGMLTGLGWTPREATAAHAVTGFANASNSTQPSVTNDIAGFGRCVEGVLRGEEWRRSGYPNEFPSKLAVEGLAGQLVEQITASDQDKLPTLSGVVKLLEELSIQEHKALGGPQTKLDVNTFGIGTIGAPLVTVMDKARALSERVGGDTKPLHQQVCARFADLYAHVLKQSGPVDAIFLRSFGPLLECFCGILERTEERQFGPVLRALSSRKAIEDYIALHHGIDRLLALLELPVADAVHDWPSQWEAVHQKLLASAIEVLSDSQAIVTSAKSTEDPRLVLAALLFELSKHRGSYSEECVRAMTTASIELAKQAAKAKGKGSRKESNVPLLPKWFVPTYEVGYSSLYEKIPNQVYLGDWFDTPVVVYKTTHESTAPGERQQQDDAFVAAAEQYSRVDHPNVIRTYGACHVGGEQLLLCEMTRTSSLPELVVNAHPAYIWSCIQEAAMGLQYLHETGIVHSSLRGSCMMLGTDDKVKLTEFGWGKQASGSNRGMARWTAPECLNGGEATIQADVYSFGMCILEALTKDAPWGPDVSEVAVISAVKKGHLPPRPKDMSVEDWALIKRMCCANPAHRVGMAAVVAWATYACRAAASTLVETN